MHSNFAKQIQSQRSKTKQQAGLPRLKWTPKELSSNLTDVTALQTFVRQPNHDEKWPYAHARTPHMYAPRSENNGPNLCSNKKMVRIQMGFCSNIGKPQKSSSSVFIPTIRKTVPKTFRTIFLLILERENANDRKTPYHFFVNDGLDASQI